jgi:hypothetical protein
MGNEHQFSRSFSLTQSVNERIIGKTREVFKILTLKEEEKEREKKKKTTRGKLVLLNLDQYSPLDNHTCQLLDIPGNIFEGVSIALIMRLIAQP